MTTGLQWLGAVGTAILLAAAPAADADPAFGCYARDYSDAHLAKHPAQVVDEIILSLHSPETHNDIFGTMWVKTANQGHVRASGYANQVLMQTLICWRHNGALHCGVECDGGAFTVTKLNSKGLTFRTDNLMVGGSEGCTGPVDLAEIPGQPVSYRLNRVPDSVCGR